MKLKKNIKGNGYGVSHKKKEKLVLEAMSECLRQYPGQSVNISLNGDKIIIDLYGKKTCEDVTFKKVKKH